ncbi:DUF3568 domain-containing protein [Desulfobacterota bacterium AH_259_B03_O07]|nr:DUF3568 domain-containing protein [Desulfobacterota bacterium AH_259_B03_O07]
MKLKKWVLLGLIAVVPLLNQGCWAAAAGTVGVAAGAGTIAYIKGELKATEAYSVPDVWIATEKAVDEMQLIVTEKEHDVTAGRLDAYTADNQKVRISLKRHGDNITEITIRIGTLGDQELSRFILSKIQKNLKG